MHPARQSQPEKTSRKATAFDRIAGSLGGSSCTTCSASVSTDCRCLMMMTRLQLLVSTWTMDAAFQPPKAYYWQGQGFDTAAECRVQTSYWNQYKRDGCRSLSIASFYFRTVGCNKIHQPLSCAAADDDSSCKDRGIVLAHHHHVSCWPVVNTPRGRHSMTGGRFQTNSSPPRKCEVCK